MDGESSLRMLVMRLSTVRRVAASHPATVVSAIAAATNAHGACQPRARGCGVFCRVSCAGWTRRPRDSPLKSCRCRCTLKAPA